MKRKFCYKLMALRVSLMMLTSTVYAEDVLVGVDQDGSTDSTTVDQPIEDVMTGNGIDVDNGMLDVDSEDKTDSSDDLAENTSDGTEEELSTDDTAEPYSSRNPPMTVFNVVKMSGIAQSLFRIF